MSGGCVDYHSQNDQTMIEWMQQWIAVVSNGGKYM